MFEISQLKDKKLPELQEVAKQLKVSKVPFFKKIRFSLPNIRSPSC